MADKAIATTWGFDHLLTKQINCVTETRLYPVLANVDAAHRVEITSSLPACSKVQIAHSLNNWLPVLECSKTGEKWTATLKVPIDTKELLFKFVLDGKTWVSSADYPTKEDGLGGSNNVLSLKGAQDLTDIRLARSIGNKIHLECSRLNASIFMHQQATDVLVITRQLPQDTFPEFDAYVSITRFCFYQKGGAYDYSQSIELPGFLAEVLFCGYLEIPEGAKDKADTGFIYGPTAKLINF